MPRPPEPPHATAEREVFAAAAALPTEEQAAFLDVVCEGRPDVRASVEAWLGEHDSNSFMQMVAGGTRVSSAQAGERIGNYKLFEKIGEGGFGTVWVAEQERPMRRRVALKIIKPGMDSREVIARFEQERQALAMMDHPHIAKVLDAGATEWGRPFFAMELVCGTRITDYCDQAKLPTAERLILFIQVCNAVQHAHQKGIIHRDLKPSNILVTLHDGVPMPKVIDFGVAKATQQQFTERTIYTQLQQMIGTPLYMSPEQAEMSGVDIDTRSDIYSLGVLLYELLTGRTPFDPGKLVEAGIDEIRRMIREQEPQTPSIFVSTMAGEHQMRAAQHRQMESAKWIGQLRGDLDWIVMKALEKDRTRRYETANALALDIKCHLASEPVRARPPSRRYRMQRTVQRNKLAFAAAGTVTAALLIALGILAVSWMRIARERNEKDFALQETRVARQAELAERQKSDAANRDLQQTNMRLADSVKLLELERAEQLFRDNEAGRAVAQLAAVLRRDAADHVTASRLVSALTHRDWALPVSPRVVHSGRVESVRFSPDGRHILTASANHHAEILDAFTGRSILSVRHEGPVVSAEYHPGGPAFVTASSDGTARVWNAADGTPRTAPLRHEGKVHGAEFSPDGAFVLTASDDKSAIVWDAITGGVKQKFSGGAEVVVARFSPDGRQVALGETTGTVRLCEVNSSETVFEFRHALGRVNWLAFSPDGRRLAAAFSKERAILWDLEAGEEIGPGLHHGSNVLCAAFSPDGEILVTTSADGAVRVWDAENGLPLAPPLMHEAGKVSFARFSPDGTMLATVCMDNSVRLWTDVKTRARPYCQPLRLQELISSIAFSPDCGHLALGSHSHAAQVWSLRACRGRGVEFAAVGGVATAAFDARGETLLAVAHADTAQRWDARTGLPVGPAIEHGSKLEQAAVSADGKYFANAGSDGTTSVWEVATRTPVSRPHPHAGKVWTVQFSPDGTRLATASADGTARVWDMRSGDAITTPLRHSDEVYGARFSPDGRSLVTYSKDKTARIWDAATGLPISAPLVHLDSVEWADFSPDGTRVVTASSDNTAVLWDPRTGQAVGAPMQHLRTVSNATFSSEGRRLFTASLDRTVRIWDARSAAPLSEPLRHELAVRLLCLSPDGARVLTTCWDGPARLWDAPTGRPLTEWLEPVGTAHSISFDATGQRFVIGLTSGVGRIWEFPQAPVPVPAWFIAFAEAQAGIRLEGFSGEELVGHRELEDIVEEVRKREARGFYERVAKWFLEDPARRAVNPF